LLSLEAVNKLLIEYKFDFIFLLFCNNLFLIIEHVSYR